MLKIAAVVFCTLIFLKAQSMFMGGGHYLALLLSVLLVLVGPLISIILAHPWEVLEKTWREATAKGPAPGLLTARLLPEQVRELARIFHDHGPRGLEEAGRRLDNAFLRQGIGMVGDGYTAADIRRVLERNFEMYLSGKEVRAAILGSLGRLAQSFGFIGTIIGLMLVLGNLGDKAEIGAGVSLALFTTLYGLLFANFLYLPLHRAYLEKIRAEYHQFLVIVEGVAGMAAGECSQRIYHKLTNSLAEESGGGRRALKADGPALPLFTSTGA